jgi:DegV family protein with EDD domain
MNIALVTDSTADIPVDLTKAHQIHVVPNLVVIDGKSLEDGKTISRQEFYERLPFMKSTPTTASASSGSFMQLYEKLFQEGVQRIISIHISSQLSGVFNAACAAAQSFAERVLVIDSQQMTLGLGFQVLAAAEAAASGATVDEILRLITNVRQRIRVVAMLDTLEYVRRSGRVSWARARLGNLLHIKPFLEVKDGHVLSLGEARTRVKGIERFKQFILETGPLERLAILHTNAEADAYQILKELNLDLPTPPLVVHVTTVIGVHVGPNGLGFAALTKPGG